MYRNRIKVETHMIMKYIISPCNNVRRIPLKETLTVKMLGDKKTNRCNFYFNSVRIAM